MSITYHRLGWLTFAYIFVQMIYRLVLLVIPKRRFRLERYGKLLRHALIILAVLMALNWTYNTISVIVT